MSKETFLKLMMLVITSSILFGVSLVVAQDPHPQPGWRETQWSQYLAKKFGGVPEQILPCGSRIDIVETEETHIITWEVEWCEKWEESIGQSLFYALSMEAQTKPVKPGVWLLKKPGDDEDYLRCLTVIRELRGKGIDIRLRVQKVSQ